MGKDCDRDGLKEANNPIGFDFEHLILDILNEYDRCATKANAVEDFLEKTDLRVRYPELKRKRGARVQIKFSANFEEHQTQLQRIRCVNEMVILSPVALAKEFRSADSVLNNLDMNHFWDALEEKPITKEELAYSLRKLFSKALQNRHAHPVGPAYFVPPVIRRFIQKFVFKEAMKTTELLRSRESRTGKRVFPGRKDVEWVNG